MSGKASCPAGCGKRFVSAEHARNHANQHHAGWDNPQNMKRKGWATPYGFGDFKEPVTYDEACESMQAIHEMFAASRKAEPPSPAANRSEGD